MKLGLIGSGKTGSYVVKRASDDITLSVFNSKNPPNLNSLKDQDILIAFVDANTFSTIYQMVLKSNVPLISGVTGFSFTEEIDDYLKSTHNYWVKAHNFSLGMQVVKLAIDTMAKSIQILKEPNLSIHEVHHTKKVDSPSGTALSWQEWISHECKITSERTGDVVGLHELTIENESEKIKLNHEAKSRAIFADGALWCAKACLNHPPRPGLHKFEDFVKGQLIKE